MRCDEDASGPACQMWAAAAAMQWAVLGLCAVVAGSVLHSRLKQATRRLQLVSGLAFVTVIMLARRAPPL